MSSNGVSRTAQAAAGARAIESMRPESERFFDDPLAEGFLKGPLWRGMIKLMHIPPLREAALAMRERQFPGAMGGLLCRTRFIDDALGSALKNGTSQVVILGAGFDSRAYRIPGIERTHVFEVDQAATLAWKQERLQQMLGALPSHVVFVPIDFDREQLGDTMVAAGFRAGAKTFFVWEGVTQYITIKAVDATLCYIRRTATAGSQIAFTYIPRGIIDGSVGSNGDHKVVQAARRMGEPWLTGFAPAELPQFLAQRGFALIEDVGASELQERYLKPKGRKEQVFKVERVALAEIAGSINDLQKSQPRS